MHGCCVAGMGLTWGRELIVRFENIYHMHTYKTSPQIKTHTVA